MLEHGGQLLAAAQRYGIPVADWLDLSTGINPAPFVPPPVPLASWQHLPQDDDELLQAATRYYGSNSLLPVAGSQAAIQLLPALRGRSNVGVLHPAYAEHAYVWRNAGHQIVNLSPQQIDAAIEQLDVLVLIHPNNPTGQTYSNKQLHGWLACLQDRGGWLIVDEAFIEATSLPSMIQAQMPPGLIVLRSLGKFFGLAGARVGFVFAQQLLLKQLQARLGPWCVSGPSRFVAEAALSDQAWQAAAHTRLQQDGKRLLGLLQQAGLSSSGGCYLFQWIQIDTESSLYQQLAQRGILTRLYTQPHSLRFGLPGSAANWERLQNALTEIAT